MRFRWLHALALIALMPLVGFAAPAAPAGKSGGPPVTFQFAPGDTVMANVDSILKTVVGENLATMMKDQIKNHLGEKGFSGLDMKKPIAGCAFLPNQVIEGEEDFKKVYGYLAIPTSGADDLQEFFNRLFAQDPLTFKPIEGKKGLYAIETRDGEAELPVRGRYHEGYFYIGFNTKDDQMNAEALPAVATMLKANETSLATIRMHIDRFPPKVLESNTNNLDDQLDDLRDKIGGFSWAEGLLVSYAAYMKRSNEQWKQADEYTFRLIHDEKTAEIVMENIVVPKKGSPLATEVADTKPSTNTFANLLTDTTAVGLLMQLPIATPELRDLIQKGVEAGEKNIQDVPEFAQPVVKELLKGLGRTAKGSSIDFALSVNPTKKDEPFQSILAITFDDASGLEKAIKEAAKHKDAPASFKDALKFDVAKIEGVNVHKFVSVDGESPEFIRQLFGNDEVYLAFGPKGIYVAVGPDHLGALKAAMSAKAAPAKAFDLAVNPKRLGDAIFTANAGVGAMARGVVGSDDKRYSAFYVTSQGGSTMTVRIGMSLKVLPKMLGSGFALRGIGVN
jgi:hypothetical protein